MMEYVGGNGVYVGSFNPPHIGHIETMKQALETFDMLHIFVRYNKGIDLVDWDTKVEWFDRMNEELGGRLVIHKMMNENIKDKTYTLEDFFAFMRDTGRVIGAPVRGFVFGDDYLKLLPAFKKEFPEMVFVEGIRPVDGAEALSSTAIREDLEGHRRWLPEYVYTSLVIKGHHTVDACKDGAPDGTSDASFGRKPDAVKQEQSLKELNLEGCPVIGRGFGSTVYALDEDTIVKVYKEGTPLAKVRQEYDLTRMAYQSGVPSVRAYDLVRVKNSFGLVLERLSSTSLGATISADPDRIDAYVEKYVALAKTLHGIHVPQGTVPATKDVWLSYVGGLDRWCTADEASLVRDLVRAMPDVDTLVHGDLHPGNIMLKKTDLTNMTSFCEECEPVLIDMPALSAGSYLCDLAVIYRGLIMGPLSPQVAQREKSMGMPAKLIREVGDRFFMGYLGLGSREKLEKAYTRLHVLYALSVVVMCGNARMKDKELAGRLMDELLRKVIVPQENMIRKIWNTGSVGVW